MSDDVKVKQTYIEGSVPRAVAPIRDAANEVLKIEAKKKALMKQDKAAKQALTQRVKKYLDENGKKGETELRILGFNLVLQSKEQVDIVEMEDDPKEEGDKGDKKDKE